VKDLAKIFVKIKAMNDKIFEDLLANRFSIISFRILGRFPAGNHIVAFMQYIKDMCEGNRIIANLCCA